MRVTLRLCDAVKNEALQEGSKSPTPIIAIQSVRLKADFCAWLCDAEFEVEQMYTRGFLSISETCNKL